MSEGPREFWLHWEDDEEYIYNSPPPASAGYKGIHVIEYSALEAANKRIAELETERDNLREISQRRGIKIKNLIEALEAFKHETWEAWAEGDTLRFNDAKHDADIALALAADTKVRENNEIR